MKFTILLSFLFYIFTFFAQQSYYNNVNLTLTGMALKTELANKITVTHTNNLSYTQIKEVLKIIDLDTINTANVQLVYGFDDTDGDVTTDATRDKNNFGGSVGQWNREHTYPKSLGTPNLGTSGPGADAHMLRASDVQRNSTRGSKKFADGSGNSSVINSNLWYPGDEWKGDVARMMMYMYLRYGNQCLPINVGVGTSVAIDPDMIDLFLNWNAEDPVSSIELARNDYLENTNNTYGQGNRNPFIDNPYLATRIWGGVNAEDTWGIYNVSISENFLLQNINIYPNPATENVTVSIGDNLQLESILVYNTSGQIIKTIDNISNSTFQINNLDKGIYFVQIIMFEGIITKRLIIE